MTISLKAWAHPKTGAIRIYISAFHEGRSGLADAHGCYLQAGEDGLIQPCYPSSWSGACGEATLEVMRRLQLNGCTFAELLERMEGGKTAGGNFSETRYFKNLAAAKVAA